MTGKSKSESQTFMDKDLMIIRMKEDTRIWNKIIFEELLQAIKTDDKFLIEYWKGMFI